MEELHTTEALDREILEDARKKALKILKTADDSISASKAAWDQKLKTTEETVRKNHAEKTEQMHREIMARFPMDKRRIRSETIDRFLNEAMAEFLGSLDRVSLLRMLEKELAQRKKEIDAAFAGSACVKYRALSREECSTLASASFPETKFNFTEDPLHNVAGSFPSFTVDFPNLRITVSADKAAAELLLEKRAELTIALLGDIDDVTLPNNEKGRNGNV